jgi:predicted Zn-dependent protease
MFIAAGRAPAEEKQPWDQELELGQEMFNELKAKGEIIESSPLYDQLRPLTDAIGRAAQPQYPHPFKFYLVHEPQPNAFATPGGNVYVVDSLLYFVKNTEELVGTLCHEVSHTIHRDSVNLMKKHQKTIAKEVGAAVLVGPTGPHVLAIYFLGKLRSLGYSREAESKADLTGSDICAQAGFNPWGLVWLFEDFKNARAHEIPQMLSDHPSDQNRIDALTKHMSANTSTFGKYSRDRASATAFSVPKNSPVVFLR